MLGERAVHVERREGHGRPVREAVLKETLPPPQERRHQLGEPIRLEVAEAASTRKTLEQGRVPATGTNPNIVVTDVTIPVGGGLPPINAKRVAVTYTHSYTFLPKIATWFGATYTTVPLRRPPPSSRIV